MYLLVWCKTCFNITYKEILSRMFILNLIKSDCTKFKDKEVKSQYERFNKSRIWNILGVGEWFQSSKEQIIKCNV